MRAPELAQSLESPGLGPTDRLGSSCECRPLGCLNVLRVSGVIICSKPFGVGAAKQLCDGSVIWTSSSGDTYVTTRVRRCGFQACMHPRALAAPDVVLDDRGGECTAVMPT